MAENKTIYTIFYKSVAVCPKCSGAVRFLHSDAILFHCTDCNSYYVATGFGHADAEFLCEEVGRE